MLTLTKTLQVHPDHVHEQVLQPLRALSGGCARLTLKSAPSLSDQLALFKDPCGVDLSSSQKSFQVLDAHAINLLRPAHVGSTSVTIGRIADDKFMDPAGVLHANSLS